MSIANTKQKTIIQEEIIDDNDQTRARVEHLKELEKLVGNSYPNKFERSSISGAEDTISNILAFQPIKEIVKELNDNTPEGEKPNQELKESLNAKLKEIVKELNDGNANVRVAGRMAVPPRVMGKAAFVHLSDGMNRLQIYVRRDDAKAVFNGAMSATSAVADGLTQSVESSIETSNANLQPHVGAGGSDTVSGWEVFQLLDHGDFIGVEGYLFLTNTGELSVHVEQLQFLSKSLLPMPDKMHGIADAEIRQRQRYADLIASSLRNKSNEEIEEEKQSGVKNMTTREVFEVRAKTISSLRHFLEDHGYIEVETPMLTPKATGAAAKPFETHHNALDITLYARIAPELYLKRLVVGGFEKVYELNRNFRNEGISYKHNPEFTMLEFYCAYMDVNGMMDFCEELLKNAVQKASGGLQVNYEGQEIDFSKFERWTMKKAISEFSSHRYGKMADIKIDEEWLSEAKNVRFYANLVREWDMSGNRIFHLTAKSNNPAENPIEFENAVNVTYEKALQTIENVEDLDYDQVIKDLVYLFEEVAEINLIQPTFIIDYPKSISPLSKASPENPQIAERFELFINGMEVANGFSELNDPQEQYERFLDQMKVRETGDEEAMVMDEDYIRALSYGMPPAAGIGIGIDRLVMLLTNKHSIRDVILFPHLRPEKREEKTERE